MSPTLMPRAAAFLWNRRMMIQITCRGYATAQFMQPEPAKYVYAPNLEARTFMQPEHPYYAHHPGRFFYFKDEDSGTIFSAPYEPVRAPLDRFCFSVGKSDVQWQIAKDGIAVGLRLWLSVDEVVEFWELEVKNISGRARQLSVYPYFPIGYMSWMNQSAAFHSGLGGIVATCVTPYQKVADYFRQKDFKDKTFLLADQPPGGWEARQESFEGEGGLMNPTALQLANLSNSEALYETPTAVLQYRTRLAPQDSQKYLFLFGAAYDESEIGRLRQKYLDPVAFNRVRELYASYQEQGSGCLQIETPDPAFDNFVNHWLARQVFYHGDVNRLTTDPQTRNYLQDAMGMSYIKPDVARAAFLHALSQQEASGAMPDGILLTSGAELKYINQIPHTDHCVWLPICLKAYLDETADFALLHELVIDRHGQSQSVLERINAALRCLQSARDARGLSYIGQGDWCDPMNMVGYKGRGVSGWLSMASAYALQIWSDICTAMQHPQLSREFALASREINQAVGSYLWDGQWFARGITDDGVVFGVSNDVEGRIFLNAQSWAILAGTATREMRELLLKAVEEHLETPYGPMLLSPSYTAMRDDIGRVTQKHPGSAENGSIYNHAAAFYIYALYTVGEKDRAFRFMRRMLPGPELSDYKQRGQLPVFIPNYYRGAYAQYPRTAGRSSQLLNTGTVSWYYRCLLDGLFGVRGSKDGLIIQPQLPAHWKNAKIIRQFRGATFNIEITQDRSASSTLAIHEGKVLLNNEFVGISPGKNYSVQVKAGGPPTEFYNFISG